MENFFKRFKPNTKREESAFSANPDYLDKIEREQAGIADPEMSIEDYVKDVEKRISTEEIINGEASSFSRNSEEIKTHMDANLGKFEFLINRIDELKRDIEQAEKDLVYTKEQIELFAKQSNKPPIRLGENRSRETLENLTPREVRLINYYNRTNDSLRDMRVEFDDLQDQLKETANLRDGGKSNFGNFVN
jgi:chromosome segregation ATPase